MKRSFNYSRNNVECVTVNPWVAKRRGDGNSKNPVIGKLVNGRLVPTGYYGKL